MKKVYLWAWALTEVLLALMVGCQPKTAPTEPPLVIRVDPSQAAAIAAETRKNTPAILAEGLTMSLWASDSLAPDPVAMSVDDQGRIYLTRTVRQKNSEFDIRGHQDWMTPSIGLQTTEDRRAFLHSTFAPELSLKNAWLKDLNGDGSHDWKDLAVEKEEVWRLEDSTGDGYADKATRIVHDFNDEITDIAGALLVREKDMFVGVGPDMWRMQDKNGDGIPEQKTSISTGYAVHIGFSGHNMSGAIEGPDGKIYWNMGDIGANITALDGKKYAHPNEGVIVRCNPDGSDFEVYAAGLRNTHEFVFDEYGNLISSDNDGDHSGESERLVHVVEGSDAGWRSNWQYGKYTDPGNNGYNVWMDEKLYVPHWEGQAAYIVPPIINYHNGPTGMVYNPGTALGSAWKNKFFLVEFVGTPSGSHIWSFGLKPKGASFELSGEKDVVSGILPTGIRFGADGALYAADWITGWDTKNYGRVWKIDVTPDKNDLAAQRKETERLMKLDYAKQTEEELSNLLGNDDMRIRQKAQFELVNRGKKGFAVFKQATAQQDKQLKRVHGVWGIGQMAHKDKSYAAALVDLLQDGDAEIVAQAVKTLGDIRYTEAAGRLVALLSQPQPRVQFFAAQSLGRMAHSEAIPALISLLETNNDQDIYLRHAAVLALSRMGQEAPITALVNHPSKALRTAAVLVLRRLRSPKVGDFLKDSDEYIVTEAARAINDDLSIEAALPALAATLADTRFTSEALLRRGINACLRVGSDKEMDLLIAFAGRKDISATLQTEALATLGSWAAPSVLDRVDGRYRTKITRDPAPIAAKVKAAAGPFLQSTNPATVAAAVKMLGALGVSGFNSNLVALMQHRDASVRSAALLALHTLKYEGLETVIKKGMEDREGSVRTTAIGLLGELETTAASLPGIVDPIFKRGTVPEQQQLLQVLGKMPAEKNEAVLEKLIAQFKAKQLAPALALDLSDAVDSTGNERLIAQLAPLRVTGTSLDAYKETLYGGNREAGIRYFFTANSAAQCIRCHAAWGQGGKVGPSLTNIGSTLTREQILQAMIEPSARLAPGYGTVVLTLDDGQVVSGVLSEERADELILKTNSAEPLEVPLARIKKRENMPSSMPPMGTVMTKREIRDVIEFLAGMK